MVMDNGNVRWFTLPGCKTCSRLSQRGMSSILLERVALRAMTISHKPGCYCRANAIEFVPKPLTAGLSAIQLP